MRHTISISYNAQAVETWNTQQTAKNFPALGNTNCGKMNLGKLTFKQRNAEQKSEQFPHGNHQCACHFFFFLFCFFGRDMSLLLNWRWYVLVDGERWIYRHRVINSCLIMPTRCVANCFNLWLKVSSNSKKKKEKAGEQHLCIMCGCIKIVLLMACFLFFAREKGVLFHIDGVKIQRQ